MCVCVCECGVCVSVSKFGGECVRVNERVCVRAWCVCGVCVCV